MTSEFSDSFKKIRDQVKEFDPYDLLSYITLLGALPGNEIKCVRLETLFKIVISTRQNKFKNSEFDEEGIKKLLSDLDSLYNWPLLEDFVPTPLFDYPAIWILGKRYSIFSGPQDRAYEYWKELVSDYFPVRNEFLVKGYDPIEIIEEILSLETDLVSLIRKHKDDIHKAGDMLIPSSELIELWKCTINEWYQNSPNQTFYEQHSVRLGRRIDHAHMIEPEPLETIYKFFSVRFVHNAVLTFQHDIFGFLNTLFLKDFKDLKDQKPSLLYDTSCRLLRNLSKLFPIENILPNFSMGNSGEVDFAVIFDHDKLFLFKILHPNFISDFQKHLDKTIDVFKKINLCASRNKRNFNVRGRPAEELASLKYEIISIILIKSEFSAPNNVSYGNRIPNSIFLPMMFLDFLSISDDIGDGMRFLKFLRLHHEAHDRMEIRALGGILDLYAQYVKQNDCLLFSGTAPHLFQVMPGVWDKYYIKKLKEKPDFQPRFNENEPDDSWDVDVIANNIFQVHNSLKRQTAGIFRLSNGRVIWVLAPNTDTDYNATETSSFNLLMQLIPHRFVKNNIFELFLEKAGVRPDQQIQILLHPTSFIKRRDLEHRYNFLSQISAKHPIIVGTKRSQTGKYLFGLFYSVDHLSDLFEHDRLGAEKTIISTILHRISDLFLQLSYDEIEEFLEQIFLNAKPAFSYTSMHHPLLLSTSTVGDYPKTQQSDTSEIQRQTAEFLNKESVLPGTYDGEIAKKISEKIADFLQISLIQKLQLFHVEKILSYSADVDGNLLQSRTAHQEQARSDAGFIAEFDPKERYHEESLKISNQSAAVRFVTELVVKTNPQGDSFLSKEKWLEIQALSEEISRLVTIRNTIYFKTGSFTIQIYENHAYAINSHIDTLIQHSKNLDYEIFGGARTTVNWGMDSDEVDDFFNNVDPPFFDEFHVGFQDFLKVLGCCMSMPQIEQKHTIVVNHAKLVPHIQSVWPEISKDAIINGLKLASLTNEDLTGINIYPTDLRNRKFRSIVKPIPVFQKHDQTMYVINSWRINASIHRWISDMEQGHLPFAPNVGERENIKSGRLKEKLEELRQKAGIRHEKNIHEIMARKTNYCYSNIKNAKKSFPEIHDDFPGEIDNLSIYPDLKKVIVIEAKHLYWNLASQEIIGEINKYTKQNGFISKFLKKIQYVKKYLRVILKHYNIEDDDGDWQVEGYFVTATIAFPIPMPDGIKSIHLNELENL